MSGIGQLLNDIDAALRKDEPSRETLETLAHAFGNTDDERELLSDVFWHLHQSGYYLVDNNDQKTEDDVLEAYNEGFDEGRTEGSIEGFEKGYSAGKEDGYDEGYEEARKEFEQKDNS